MKNNNRFRFILVLVLGLVSINTNAASVSGQGTWETTLQGRDLDGNPSTYEAYYDTALNITWLADANYAGTAMGWTGANIWAAGLNPYDSGITGWRLPTVTATDGPDADLLGNDGCNFGYTGTDCGYNVNTAASEMAHMFHTTLGNKSRRDTAGNYLQAGWGLANTGPFSNVHSDAYWSATEYAPNTSGAWSFFFSDGSQRNYVSKTYGFYAWAVHAGDVGVAATVSTVPVPAAAWLFGSGLLGLLGIARRKKK